MWLGIGAAVIILVLLIPASQRRTITEGIDSYSTHRPLAGSRTQSQLINSNDPITGVGAILVDFVRANQLVDVQIRILHNRTQEEIATTTIPSTAIQDDRFAFTSLPSAITAPPEGLLLEFSAPQATGKNPIGIRFDSETLTHQRLENGEPEDGTLAIQLIERVPLWRVLHTTIIQNKRDWTLNSISMVFALLLAVLSLKPGWSHRPRHIQRAIQLGIIISLAAVAFNIRFTQLEHIGGVTGGDPYNYLFITKNLTEFENPFASKRLPGYPLLLVPSYFSASIDDITVMRLLSLAAGAGSLIMLSLLARSLKLPWTIQLFAPALLGWQKDFFWVSFRPEPYTIYTFLLLTSLVLFLTLNKSWKQILFGLVLGYAAMTRQEGFVLAVILGVASLFRWRSITGVTTPKLFDSKLLLPYTRAFLPALLIVLPFFIHNAIVFNNPLYTKYFEGERLQIVDSYPAFLDALGGTWGVIGSMWRVSWEQLERYSLTAPLLLIGFLGIIVWWGLWQTKILWKRPELMVSLSLAATVLATATLWGNAFGQGMFTSRFPLIAAGILLASSIPFLIRTKWNGTIVWIVMLSQILIATWFHPFPKHYQQSYPLFILMIATALAAPAAIPAFKKTANLWLRNVTLATSRTALTLPYFIVMFLLLESMFVLIDDHNANAALDSVAYRATEFAQSLPLPVGFDEAYLPSRVYFDEHDEVQYFPAEDNPTPQQEQQWLDRFKPKTMVVTNANNIFTDIPSSWQQVAHFKAEGKNERLYESWVYILP